MIVDLDAVVLTPDGNISTWNAVGNPVLYKMQRKDFIFDQVNNDGGFVQLQFNGIDLTGSFTVDDLIYLLSVNGVYDSFGVVTASAFSTNTLITTDVPYDSAAPGGFVNNDTLRRSYRIEVEVFNSDDEALTDGPFIFSPNSKGVLNIDVSGILRPHISPNIDADLTGSDDVFIDTPAFIKFYIKYTEVWIGSAETQIDDVANQFFVVIGARQIPSQYGGNMFEYVTWDGFDPKALWLSKFDEFIVYRGYPFLLSAIIGEPMTADVQFYVEYFDALDSPLTTEITTETISGELVIWDVTETGDGVPDEATYGTVRLIKEASGDLIDARNIEIRNPCDNPVMLLSRNSLGGVLQWMFEGSQEYTFDYGNDRKAKRLVLTAQNLTINQWEALQDFVALGDVYKDNIVEFDETVIKTSSRIGQQVYVVEPDGSKIGVIVIPTKNKTTTRNRKHDFEIEIEFPEVFTP